MLTQTSIFAYESVKGDLSKRQSEVLEALRTIQPADNNQLSEYLNWPINRVTPRIKELREKGVVEKAYIGKGKFGPKVFFWREACGL